LCVSQWIEEESFQLRVEAPERVSAWEHVGLRITALNKHVEDVTAHITLAHSQDYKFIAMEDFVVTGVSKLNIHFKIFYLNICFYNSNSPQFWYSV